VLVADTASERLVVALDAAHRAQAEPGVALDTALALLAEDVDDHERAAAHWAAGLAHRERGELDAARDHLEASVAKAIAARRPSLAAEARSSLSLVLTYLGDPEGGLVQADLAEPHLRGGALARVRMQRALIHQRLGLLDEALAGYRRALPGLVRAGDRVAQVRLRVNRSIAHTYRGDLAAAAADLLAARALAEDLGQALQMAACAHNLAFLHGRRGDVPEALVWFDRARSEYRPLGVRAGFGAVLAADRAELLLAAGLTGEARRSAEESLAALDGANRVEEAEVRLLAARVAVADDDPSAAADHARRAADAFADQGRTSWSVLAEHVALLADARAAELHPRAAAGSDGSDRSDPDPEPPGAVDPDRAAAVADLLAAHGWTLEALAARTLAGRLALAAGDHARAERELAAAAPARRRGPAGQRAQAWYAEALRRSGAGDAAGARRAVASGLRVIDEHRATLGATELRARVGALGEQLAALGVELALADGRPAGVLAAVEAWRAGSLLAPARPPRDPATADLLVQLRTVEANLRERLADGAGPGDLGRRRATLEAEIRDRARHVRSHAATRPGPPGTVGDDARDGRALVDALGNALGDRVLVEWFTSGGALHVVVVADGRTTTAVLGDASQLWDELASARFCLQRLARGAGSATAQAATRATLAHAAAQLGAALLGSVPGLAGRDLVLVPTGALHHIPWGALPELRATSFAVVPSARAWLDAMRRPPPQPGARPLLVAGPDLPGAVAEVAALARAYGAATVLEGDDARSERVLAALGRTSVAHLATHGTFRSDNPLFSSLRLADGELTVHDLEALDPPPALVVLSACDAGSNTVGPGDEVLGLAAALLGMGVRTLVAPVVPVPDDAAAELMVLFHAHLRAGDHPARALQRAAAATDDEHDPRRHAAARSFLTLGA
jgi:tetratricopeptide (TPR) repeat protein